MSNDVTCIIYEGKIYCYDKSTCRIIKARLVEDEQATVIPKEAQRLLFEKVLEEI